VILKTRRPSKSDESHFGVSMPLKRASPLIEIQCHIEKKKKKENSLISRLRWFCFHVGRPSSLSLKGVAIEHSKNPFVRLLAELCKTVSRSCNEIYGQRHESLLHMWRVARSITHDLRSHEVQMQQELGFGLNASVKTGSLAVCQTIFITCKISHPMRIDQVTQREQQCTIIPSF
jgi:hypothetical protein